MSQLTGYRFAEFVAIDVKVIINGRGGFAWSLITNRRIFLNLVK